MDKQLRDSIKHDKFVEEVGHTVHYLADHKAAVRKYGVIAAGVLVVVGAVYGYTNYQAGQRQEDLRKASAVVDAFIGDVSPYGGPAFKTQAEKDAAAVKALSEVAAKHKGTKEGLVARYSASTLLCDQGKVAECEAGFKEVAAGSDPNAASLARMSLATLYQSQGKMEEAEAVAKEMINKPSVVVSKEQAQITFARIIMKKRPQEAKLLLESLQAMDRPGITRAAVAVMGEMMGQPPAR